MRTVAVWIAPRFSLSTVPLDPLVCEDAKFVFPIGTLSVTRIHTTLVAGPSLIVVLVETPTT